jgi:hypothetical protein
MKDASMTLEQWAHLSTIGQFVLVAASVIFIWLQVRQSVQVAKAANAQALAEQAGNFNALLIQDREVARIWYSRGKGLDGKDFEGLAAAERYRELLIQWLILHENIYYQKTLLDPELYQSWAADLESTLKKHAWQVISPRLDSIFSGSFGRHLVSLQERAQLRSDDQAKTECEHRKEMSQSPSAQSDGYAGG